MDPNANLQEICEHLFYVDGDYDRCVELIEALAEWIASDGFEPKTGFLYEWSDVLVGAYWFLVNYHSGQWSDEYRVSCVIGKVYTPGAECNGPEKDSCESDVYEALESLLSESVRNES